MKEGIMEKKKNLVLDVDEHPKRISQWFLFALQHVLAMFVACITVPMITGLPIAPTIVASGIGTLIYVWITKGKSPVYLSSSFAYLAPMSSALALGVSADALGNVLPNYQALMVGMIMVGAVYCGVALIIKIFGVKWLNRLLPTIVIGPVIMVIGLSLSTSAISNLTNVNAGADNYNLCYVTCGLIAMFATAISAHYGKKTLALIPFVIGMLAGYFSGIIFTVIGYGVGNEYFKVIDFAPIVDNFKTITFTSFIDCPDFLFALTGTSFNVNQISQVALLFVPVAFVTICEHIGDHKNLSNIISKDLLVDPGLDRTLIGDGLATAVSGVVCGAANTTYGENVAVVGVSKIASTSVIVLAAIFSILIGFIKPLMIIIETIPTCVTGGVSLILYGFIASSGVKMLIKERIDFNNTKNMFIASVILVSGIGGLTLKFGNPTNPTIEITSIAISMLLGILLNVILKDKKDSKKREVEKE